MGSKEKLVERFKKKPKDFTYEETVSLLGVSKMMQQVPILIFTAHIQVV